MEYTIIWSTESTHLVGKTCEINPGELSRDEEISNMLSFYAFYVFLLIMTMDSHDE